MGGLAGIADNYGAVLNAVGVVGGLFLTAIGLFISAAVHWAETKERRTANLLTLTSNRTEIWNDYSCRPELKRVRDPSADVIREPVTYQEEEFVITVILHINSAYYAGKNGLMIKMAGLQRDICEFISLPIPRTVWKSIKELQNDDFVEFVEQCLNYSGQASSHNAM